MALAGKARYQISLCYQVMPEPSKALLTMSTELLIRYVALAFQEVNKSTIFLSNGGGQEASVNEQWNYIFSDPMYLLIVVLAVFLNIVLLRKLIKKEL